MMLCVKNLHVYYGGIHALDSISIDVDEGEIVTMIGANGAGKSTTIRSISGLVRARSGEIIFEGRAIHGAPPHEIVMLGVGQSPEGRRVFSNMSVRENLELGAYTRKSQTAQVKGRYGACVYTNSPGFWSASRNLPELCRAESSKCSQLEERLWRAHVC